MFTKTQIAIAAVAVLGFAGVSAAQAGDNDHSGEYHGGFVIPGSMDGVNPVYHPDLFPNRAKGSKAYGSADRGSGWNAYGYAGGGNAYGYANEGNASGYNGVFINGNFIPRGTSPAQVPDHREEY